jgi:tetratricopeptide (TPR) repeat protein
VSSSDNPLEPRASSVLRTIRSAADSHDQLELLRLVGPDVLDAELWRSDRALLGDPDLGLPGGADGQEHYVAGLDAMRAGDAAGANAAFTEAAKRGHAGAWRELATALWYDAPKEARLVALPLFQKGAAGGDGRSIAYLGVFCQVNRNLEGALECFRAADAAGDPNGSRELGKLLETMGDNDAALAALRRARDRGSAAGALALATYLEDNNLSGIEAAFARAAELGHPKGALGLWWRQTSRNDPEAPKTKATILPLAQKHQAYFAVYDPNIVAALNRAMNSAPGGAPKSSPATTSATAGGGCLIAMIGALLLVTMMALLAPL